MSEFPHSSFPACFTCTPVNRVTSTVIPRQGDQLPCPRQGSEASGEGYPSLILTATRQLRGIWPTHFTLKTSESAHLHHCAHDQL